MSTATALFVTDDDLLLDDLLRLAAASGVVPEVAHDASAGLRSWSGAGIVLVGADRAEQVLGRRPPRRAEVHVVTRSPADGGLFRAALGLGAQDVVELPAGEAWLVDRLTDATDGAAAVAVTVGVVAGSGGAGATTFACALGIVGGRRHPALLVDLDPWGPGADRVAGFDDEPGVRWHDLLATPGRLSARALRDAVPRRAGLGVLTWGAAQRVDASTDVVDDGVLTEVLASARRGHDLVVLDLARHSSSSADLAVAHCDHVVVVARLGLPAAAAAARTVARLRASGCSLHLVTRGSGGGGALAPEQVAQMLDLPLLAELGTQRRLEEHVDLGLGPVHPRRGPLSRTAGVVLDRLVAPSRAAA